VYQTNPSGVWLTVATFSLVGQLFHAEAVAVTADMLSIALVEIGRF